MSMIDRFLKQFLKTDINGHNIILYGLPPLPPKTTTYKNNNKTNKTIQYKTKHPLSTHKKINSKEQMTTITPIVL